MEYPHGSVETMSSPATAAILGDCRCLWGKNFEIVSSYAIFSVLILFSILERFSQTFLNFNEGEGKI
jgi:hypothetical protein